VSLRRAFLVFAGTFAMLAVVAIGALVLLTSYLHRTTVGIGEALESVHLAEQLEIQLLSHNRARDPIVRAALEEELRQLVKRGEQYLGTPDERRLLADLSENLDHYVRAWHPRGAPAPEFEALQSQTAPQLEVVFSSARRFIQTNLDQSRGLKAQAERWDETANIGGTALAIILVVGFGALVLWVQVYAFQPVITLTRAIERYSSGDTDARAPESGLVEYRWIAHRFNDLAAALEKQRASQLAFLAGVAHDLRNPLAALKLASGVISADRPMPAEARVRTAFARVQRQIDRLERMVSDFLDAARVEAGVLELKLEECDPLDVARATLELFEPSAPAHQLVLEAQPGAIRCTADPARLEQVLNNLVSNAIKYSPQGGRVSLAVAREDAEIVFSVADQGIGISAGDLAALFEPFHRSGGSKDAFPGVGLGLFVSRRIVEAHGGRLTVQTSPGLGSKFSVHLPALPSASPVAPA
jgi:two-component system sensor histidine kinase MtrB